MGGATKQEGGGSFTLPKKEGGGGRNSFSHPKEGGTKGFVAPLPVSNDQSLRAERHTDGRDTRPFGTRKNWPIFSS